MTEIVNWQIISTKLPGIYLQDQEPEGCGLAVSIECAEVDAWTIHYAKEQTGKTVYYKTKPLSAFVVFQTLEKLFKEIGYTPELSDSEYDMLELPRKESIYNQSLAEKMPGEWLGVPDGEDDSGWATHYSVSTKADGKYILYSGALNDGDDFLAKAEVEKYGVFDLSEILDELRMLGFKKGKFSFLLTLHADSWQDLEKQLPGAVLPNPKKDQDIIAACISPHTEGQWKLFIVKKQDFTTYTLQEQLEIEPRAIYHFVYDHFGVIIPDAALEKTKLPALDKIFDESLEKKLKGYYIGQVSGMDENHQPQKRFVSLLRESKISWSMQYVKSEELLSGNRKIVHHKTDPFLEENIYKFMLRLEPLFDPLDVYTKMSEQKNPEIAALAELFVEQMEAE